MVKNKILKLLEDEDKVIIARELSEDEKSQIVKLEMKRLDEMVPVINKGLEEALNEDYAVLVIKDKRGIFLPDEELIPTLTLETDAGKVIGEEIYDPEELEELKNDPEAYFISEHFVTYPNIPTSGEKQFFVVSDLYGELDCEDKMNEITEKLVIATPSTEADHFIKDCFGMDYEDGIITMIIGFS